jgi:hypothetical protein
MACWQINQIAASYLVSLDIVGFTSGEHTPMKYLLARKALEKVVLGTQLVNKCIVEEKMPIQFIGDELRFAFLATSNTPNDIFECLNDIFDKLLTIEYQIRAVVVTGAITPTNWNNCLVLKGAPAMKAERWLNQHEVLTPGIMAVDESFNLSLSACQNGKYCRFISIGHEIFCVWKFY